MPRFRSIVDATLALLLASGCCLQAQNQAVTFPATNTSWISAPAGPELAPITGVTVEGWVRVNDTMAPSRGIIFVPSAGNSASTYFSYLVSVSANLQGNIVLWQGETNGFPTNGGWNIPGGPFSTGAWHHFAGTYDGSMARLYVDGVLKGGATTNGSIRAPEPQLRIGSLYNGFFFQNGAIDCLRIWSYPRSQADIAAFRFFELPSLPGLVASWRFNGDLEDSIGAHDGTAMGTISMASPGAPFTSMLSAPPALPVGHPLSFLIATPFPGTPYIVDISLNGTSPGVLLPEGIVIPLNHPWLNYDSGGAYSSYFNNFLGVTNAAGSATVLVALPSVQWLAGYTVSATYAVLTPQVPYSIGFVAPPTQTLLLP